MCVCERERESKSEQARERLHRSFQAHLSLILRVSHEFGERLLPSLPHGLERDTPEREMGASG